MSWSIPPISPPNLEIIAISRGPLDPGWKPIQHIRFFMWTCLNMMGRTWRFRFKLPQMGGQSPSFRHAHIPMFWLVVNTYIYIYYIYILYIYIIYIYIYIIYIYYIYILYINTNSCWLNHQNIAKSYQKHGATPATSIQSQVKHQYSLAKHQQQCLGVTKHQAVVLSLFICFPKIKTR